MTHSMPLSTCRSSRVGCPIPGFCSGINSLTRSHSASVILPASGGRMELLGFCIVALILGGIMVGKFMGGGVLGPMARLVAALGYGLVSPPPK